MGFTVWGVDRVFKKTYPYRMTVADAIEVLHDTRFLSLFDVIHASPPCQENTRAKHLRTAQGKELKDHGQDLITPVREALRAWGGVYVIENVPGAPSSMHTYLEVLVRNSPKVRVLNAPAVTHDAPMQFVTLGQREFCLPPNLECFSRFLSIARLAITGQFSTPHDGSSSFRVVPPMAFSAMHHIGQALESSDGRPSNVLSVCHCLKMPRIDARLLSTEVIQLQSFGHCSTDDLVCNPICHAHSPVVFHLTVPVCTETGRPQPTTIRNVHDMTHEAFPIGVIH